MSSSSATRSRFELAIAIFIYAAKHGDGSGTVPAEFFRNEDEIAVAASLSAWEMFTVGAILTRRVQQQARNPRVRSAAGRIACVLERGAATRWRPVVVLARPVACTVRSRPRPRGRRRARAPARKSEPERPPLVGGRP